MAHILIIDDSPTDVKVLTGALEKAGHKVTAVTDAERASPRPRRNGPI